MKRIVLFVEGEGEVNAMPTLVKRILTEQRAWESHDVYLDPHPFRVGHVAKLLKHSCSDWKRKLAACAKRSNLGGVLLVLDGDVEQIEAESFCAGKLAGRLAAEASAVGGGSTFSVAVVFALQEYESWLIAGAASLAGKQLPDGRRIAPLVDVPGDDLEKAPRDAKKWIGRILEGGYQPTRDQALLTGLIDLQSIRARRLRSFRRLEAAVAELVLAVRQGQPVGTPRFGH